MKLNFGSLGKGYALDRCAARLIAGGMQEFLLHSGQSSILARGGVEGSSSQRAGPFPAPAMIIGAGDGPARRVPRYWPIGLPHPFRPKRRLGEIRLIDRALGTSSSRFQSFRHEGKLLGHILDPRTGRPAEGVLSATVLAPTATLADALSTAFYVLGPEKLCEYCGNHPEISAILLVPSACQGGCEIITAGLDAEVFQQLP